MTEAPWSQYDQAFKRLHDKLVEILSNQMLLDVDKHGQVDVLSMPPVSVEVAEKGFSNTADVPTRALVDGDRHVQADVLTMPPVTVEVNEKGFSNAADVPTRALVDADRHVQADVLSMPPVSVEVAEKGFSNAADAPTRALVDSDRHVQVDVLNFPTDYAKEASLTSELPRKVKGDQGLLKQVSPTDLRLSVLAEVSNQILRDADGHGQVDVLSLPALPAGTNTIGNVNAFKSGTWHIDNLLNPHPVKITPEDRVLNVNQYSGTFAPTAAGSTTIITAVAGAVIRIYDYTLWNSGTADVDVRLYFATSGKNLFKGKLAPKTGVLKSFIRPWECPAGDSLSLYLDAAGTVDYSVGGVQA